MAKTIRIGSEYKAAFENIMQLCRRGYAPQNVSLGFDGKSINYNGSTFIYSDYFKTIASASGNAIAMNEDGASWFKSLRTGIFTDDTGANEWLELIETVATYFHSNNSFLEFSQKKTSLSASKVNEHFILLKKFFDTFYKDRNIKFEHIKDDSALVDIYAVSFIMYVTSGGVGQPQKVLGKVFFQNVNGRFVPLLKNEGKNIENEIVSVLENGNKNLDSDIANPVIVGNVLNALDKVINAKDSSKNFTTTVSFNQSKDEEIVKALMEQGPNEEVELRVSKLKVLNMYHVKWMNYCYKVLCDNNLVMKASFDSTNSLTLYCSRCFDEDNTIVLDNTITCCIDSELEKTKEYKIDFSKDNLGFDEDTIEEIKTTSDMSKHFLVKECQDVDYYRYNSRCRRFICKSDIMSFNDKEYCKNCNHIKVMYKNQYGFMYPTGMLAYAVNKGDLVDKNEVTLCACCNRTFTKDYLVSNRLCKICSSAMNTDNLSTNVYDMYKIMLPVSLRSINKTKYAAEDAELVIFNVNGKLYKFEKENLNDTGYIKEPVHIKKKI